jgi:hypothetical protein
MVEMDRKLDMIERVVAQFGFWCWEGGRNPSALFKAPQLIASPSQNSPGLAKATRVLMPAGSKFKLVE